MTTIQSEVENCVGSLCDDTHHAFMYNYETWMKYGSIGPCVLRSHAEQLYRDAKDVQEDPLDDPRIRIEPRPTVEWWMFQLAFHTFRMYAWKYMNDANDKDLK
jgi:hypothetical protein